MIVKHHRVKYSAQKDQFLRHHVCRNRNPFSHQDLVPGAADADDVELLCTDFLRLGLHLACHVNDEVAEKWVVAMDSDIDAFLVKHREVGFAEHKLRGAKQHIAQVRRYLRTCVVR